MGKWVFVFYKEGCAYAKGCDICLDMLALVGSCEHGNEISGSTKGGEFLQ